MSQQFPVFIINVDEKYGNGIRVLAPPERDGTILHLTAFGTSPRWL
jgi:hypothetical protein